VSADTFKLSSSYVPLDDIEIKIDRTLPKVDGSATIKSMAHIVHSPAVLLRILFQGKAFEVAKDLINCGRDGTNC